MYSCPLFYIWYSVSMGSLVGITSFIVNLIFVVSLFISLVTAPVLLFTFLAKLFTKNEKLHSFWKKNFRQMLFVVFALPFLVVTIRILSQLILNFFST